MTAYLRRSCLSSGGLSISLRNELGQLQDAESVLWTVVSAHSGKRVSGIAMRAIRRGVGQYYAPWYADDPTGAYEIIWEYQRDFSSQIERVTERFFVMDLDDPKCRCGHIRGLPPPGGHVFELERHVYGRELVLRLTNEEGVQEDAYDVLWRIECLKGNVLVPWQSAEHLSIGEYGVDWVVNVQGGQYFVRWQWKEFIDAPLSEAVDTFQVVNPADPKQGVEPVGVLTTF